LQNVTNLFPYLSLARKQLIAESNKSKINIQLSSIVNLAFEVLVSDVRLAEKFGPRDR